MNSTMNTIEATSTLADWTTVVNKKKHQRTKSTSPKSIEKQFKMSKDSLAEGTTIVEVEKVKSILWKIATNIVQKSPSRALNASKQLKELLKIESPSENVPINLSTSFGETDAVVPPSPKHSPIKTPIGAERPTRSMQLPVECVDFTPFYQKRLVFYIF